MRSAVAWGRLGWRGAGPGATEGRVKGECYGWHLSLRACASVSLACSAWLLGVDMGVGVRRGGVCNGWVVVGTESGWRQGQWLLTVHRFGGVTAYQIDWVLD